MRDERSLLMEPLMTPEDVSRTLGISVGTLYQWRQRGKGPKGFRVGRHVRYRRESVRAFIDQQAKADS